MNIEEMFNKPSTPVQTTTVTSTVGVQGGTTCVKFEDTHLPNIIELRNITQEYEGKQGKVTIIKDLNLLIEDKPNQGQLVVMLGTSGCGKSTVLRYIAGLQTPTSGDVLIHDKIRTKDTRISMVFQKYSSFPWLSIVENVELGLNLSGMPKKERREKAMHMLGVVGLTDQATKYPAELSGGQQQRVAIARSLLCNSSILLMDEPFGALDSATRLRMQDFLADLWVKSLSDMTVVFITHDIPEAVYLGDEIWIMGSKPGRIVDRIHVDIPINRAKEMKRDKKFTDYVYYIEDKLNSL
jgi:NitT/TauT family transport system ATP-binding protein